ncbi:hypothetical protein D3C86_2184500 [compost metagenome]
MLAAMSVGFKVAVDVVAALPGMDKGLAFRRVEDPVPPQVVQQIRALLSSASTS